MRTAHAARCSACLVAAISAAASLASAQENPASADPNLIQGFSEPYRMLHLATAESGVLEQLLVEEGDRVRSGQPLAVLDAAVHKALVQVAAAVRDAQAEIQVAEADSRLREHRLQQLRRLHQDHFASEDEVRRAQAEAESAAAHVQAARERQTQRRLEHEKLLAQLAARTLRAPQDGVISVIHKRPGEFVGPNDPVVFHLVQLQPLAVQFQAPRDQAPRFRPGQTVGVLFTALGRRAAGTIEFVSPVVQADSGTVAIRVRIDNADGRWRAGEPCQLQPDGALINSLARP